MPTLYCKLKQQPAKFSYKQITWILASNQFCYFIADFSFVSDKWVKSFTSRGKIQRFVASDRIRMIYLQDSAGIRYKDVYDVAPVNSRFVSPTASRLVLSSAVSHINWLCILLSSNFLFVFLKRSWRWNFTPNKGGRQVPAKTQAGGNPCNFSPNKHRRICIVGLRTYGRTDGRAEVTSWPNQNFSHGWV